MVRVWLRGWVKTNVRVISILMTICIKVGGWFNTIVLIWVDGISKIEKNNSGHQVVLWVASVISIPITFPYRYQIHKEVFI